ncbi:hypothetical protein FA10DRAFT_265149 [Acaromyces ingoldii]|uniref:DUF7918 domain-containing protein n=1 Tax=Acaromyces ingoldii TaxID=215250 RepID=A0A316YPX5_9BASI|nr:hypothetical protein FA10DRAFT_265149 [Acaromyces ingoldii]PWN91281.1 hypothetical protein FA10DRAFT_265149 [Acaromyces ingoldii]
MPFFEEAHFESWIEVDGVRAEEYQTTLTVEGNEIIKTCWIEAREGAKFQFRGQMGLEGARQFQARFFADGTRAASYVYPDERDRDMTCKGFDLEDGTHPFFFGPMDKTSEESSKEEQRKLEEIIGTLELRVRPCTLELSGNSGKGSGERNTAKVFEDSKLAKLGISVRSSEEVTPRGYHNCYHSTPIPGSKTLVTRFKYMSRPWLERLKIVERTCEDETVVDNATVNNDDETEDDNATVTDTKPVIRSRVTKREALHEEDRIPRAKKARRLNTSGSASRSVVVVDLTGSKPKVESISSSDEPWSRRVGPTIVLE